MSDFKSLIDNATIQIHEQRTDYLSSGECGAALLATLHADIDKIRTLPDTADDFIFRQFQSFLKRASKPENLQ